MTIRRFFFIRFSPQIARISLTGFTLVESLIIVLLLGILSAISAATWLTLMSALSLNAAQEEVLQAMRKAQHNARLNRVLWEFIIREAVDTQVQWAILPSTSNQLVPQDLIWRSLDPRVQLDRQETTLLKVNGVHRIQFNHLGAVNGQLGRVTLAIKGSGRSKRCVIVSTLLGALRLGSDQARPINGRYCQ
jgi:Tfp pilus assembly protein FimT